MRLLLFDIDGTLIKINGSGRRVLKKALLEVYGITGPIDEYSFAGRTDLQIVRDLLGAAGLEEGQIATGLTDLFSSMATWGEILFIQDGLEPCDGVLALLERISTDARFTLGLQTGNSEATAKLKLGSTGIDPSLFKVGAYGSDSAVRNELVPIAWQRAMDKMKIDFSAGDTIVIGDTPADIECAHTNGTYSIAVATGSYSIDELSRHHPTTLLFNMSDTNHLVEIMSG